MKRKYGKQSFRKYISFPNGRRRRFPRHPIGHMPLAALRSYGSETIYYCPESLSAFGDPDSLNYTIYSNIFDNFNRCIYYYARLFYAILDFCGLKCSNIITSKNRAQYPMSSVSLTVHPTSFPPSRLNSLSLNL